MHLRIISPTTNLVVPIHSGIWFDEAAQELKAESNGKKFSFRCVKLRQIDPLRISFSALTLPGSGLGQVPEDVILDFYFNFHF